MPIRRRHRWGIDARPLIAPPQHGGDVVLETAASGKQLSRLDRRSGLPREQSDKRKPETSVARARWRPNFAAMRFATLPLGEAEGAILVHGVRAGGRLFKKGRVLTPADLAQLGRSTNLAGYGLARSRSRRPWPKTWPRLASRARLRAIIFALAPRLPGG